MKTTFYRPEWTCGRYNAEHKVSLMYNLVTGFTYFFEDASAEVVGAILSFGRNGAFEISQLATLTGIAEESLLSFTEELCNVGLVANRKPTPEDVLNYRHAVSEWRIQEASTTQVETKDKLPFAVTTAEMDYMTRIGGGISVMFELTYRCSEKCIHCYNIGATRNDEEVSHRGDLEEMTFDDYKRIIDELDQLGVTKVVLSGGDPFSNKYAWEIIEYLYQKEIAFGVYTNGLSIVNHVDRLMSYHPMLVGVSIYSADADVHDYITRVPGSWQKSMRVVEQLSRLGAVIEMKCCVMRPNIKGYRKVADLAKQYGAVIQYEINVTDSVDGDKCASKYLRLTPEQLKVVLRDDNVKLYVGPEAPNYGAVTRPIDSNPCGAGDGMYCITPDGILIACCALHLEFGNLKKQTIQEILNHSEKLKWWQHLTLREYEGCGDYEYCAYCNLCPGMNMSEHGTPTKPAETNCELAKVRWEVAHEMMQGIDPLRGKTIEECLDEMPEEKFNLKREIQ